MLQDAGLKNSLGRLKIIEALRRLAGEQGRVSCKELHWALAESGSPLSLVSVRQVLRRLAQKGLVVREGVDFYRLAAVDETVGNGRDVPSELVGGFRPRMPFVAVAEPRRRSC
ncbi:hypothetical protein D9M68_264830 [compost metagenome]